MKIIKNMKKTKIAESMKDTDDDDDPANDEGRKGDYESYHTCESWWMHH